MMTFFFTAVVGLWLYGQYRIEGRWVNLYSVLMFPYLFVVVLNNLFFCRLGFYKISDEVLIMFMGSFLCFYIGGLPFVIQKIRNKTTRPEECDTVTKLRRYNIKRMTALLYFIAVFNVVRLYFLYRSGAFFNSADIDSSEGVASGGLGGHLLNLACVISPIVFLYWTYNKKRVYYLIPVVLVLVCNFASLVKYHIIGQLVVLSIIVGLYRPSLTKAGSVVLAAAASLVFILNYYVISSVGGYEFQSEFYINHLWKYVSGSLITDNYIFDGEIRSHLSVFYMLMCYLCALPNLFLSLAGIELFPLTEGTGYHQVGEYEEGNVIDAFGTLYNCSTKGAVDLGCYIIVVILIGFVAACITDRLKSYNDRFNVFAVIFLTYFVFFSFFGTFYLLSRPWEILVYSAIVPNLFRKKRTGKTP